MALDRLALDAADREVLRVDRGDRALGVGLVGERKLVELLAVQMREPRGEARRPARCMSASMVQYSCALNASISVSRSQTRRSATDCTRPADLAPGSLRHSTGESVKPTR